MLLTQKEKNSRTTNNIVESISPHKEKFTPTQSGQRHLKIKPPYRTPDCRQESGDNRILNAFSLFPYPQSEFS